MARGRGPEQEQPKRKRGRPPKNAINPITTKEMESRLADIKSVADEAMEKLLPQPYIYVGMDQRSTKNLGNFETFVFGFSLTMPTPFEPGDDISKPETCERLRKKYEGVSNFISGLMKSVEGQVDVAQDKIATPPVIEVVSPPETKPIDGNQSTQTTGLPPGSQDEWPPRATWGPQGTATIIKEKPSIETPPSPENAF